MLLSGCSVFNPYDSEFSCPGGYKGKCISVNGAYKEAVDDVAEAPEADDMQEDEIKDSGAKQSDEGGVDEACVQHNNSEDPLKTEGACVRKIKKPVKQTKELQNYNRYRSALYDKFGNLLKEPKTPIVSPPKTMRVLLMPYTGQENEFYMLRYVYFFVDEPRWLLGDSVMAEDGEEE